MSETERPFLPMSGELGGDFMSGMADSIRERRAREVPERKEGVDEEKDEEKIRSTIASLERTLFVLLVVTIATIASIIGAVSSADWLLFGITAGMGITAGFGAGAGLTLLVIYQELRRFRR